MISGILIGIGGVGLALFIFGVVQGEISNAAAGAGLFGI